MKTRKIINGALQLRKLAPRSIIGFGKYSDLMVGDLLKGEYNYRQYLAWTYYNKDLVSFLDDILEDLGIVGDLVIEKPGINPNIMTKWRYAVSTDRDRLIAHNDKNRTRKSKAFKSHLFDKKTFSKGSMQNRNHGKQ